MRSLHGTGAPPSSSRVPQPSSTTSSSSTERSLEQRPRGLDIWGQEAGKAAVEPTGLALCLCGAAWGHACGAAPAPPALRSPPTCTARHSAAQRSTAQSRPAQHSTEQRRSARATAREVSTALHCTRLHKTGVCTAPHRTARHCGGGGAMWYVGGWVLGIWGTGVCGTCPSARASGCNASRAVLSVPCRREEAARHEQTERCVHHSRDEVGS
jgi:hypothetical protein